MAWRFKLEITSKSLPILSFSHKKTRSYFKRNLLFFVKVVLNTGALIKYDMNSLDTVEYFFPTSFSLIPLIFVLTYASSLKQYIRKVFVYVEIIRKICEMFQLSHPYFWMAKLGSCLWGFIIIFNLVKPWCFMWLTPLSILHIKLVGSIS